MKHLRVNEYDMAFIEVGRGPPLYACTARSAISGRGRRCWGVSSTRSVIAPSLRHFFPEQWDGVGGRYTIAQHVSDVIAFLVALNAGPVDLMGHSRGGHIAFRVAQQRPDLLRRLILAEPGGELDASFADVPETGTAPSRSNRVAAAAERIATGDVEGALELFIDGMGGKGAWAHLAASTKQEYRDNARTLLGQINEQRQPFTRAQAESIAVPTLFIGGERTGGALPVVLRTLAQAVRGSKTVMIPNASHHMIRQDPVRTSAAVLKFLSSP